MITTVYDVMILEFVTLRILRLIDMRGKNCKQKNISKKFPRKEPILTSHVIFQMCPWAAMGTAIGNSVSMAVRVGGNESRGKAWFFTWNNPPDSWAEQLRAKFSEADKYVCQMETGESGTPHIQGYVEWRRRKRFGALVRLLPGAHVEKCNNAKAAAAYCQKVESRSGDTIRKGVRKALVDKIAGKLFPWQLDLDTVLDSDPDDRTILWYSDPKGASGKTSYVRHWLIQHPKTALMVSGKASDIKCGVKLILDQGQDVEVVFFCFARTLQEFVSYQAIEEVKDALFFSGKYEGGVVLFNPPHVVCFANFEPRYEALTHDRWSIHHLST